MRTRSLNLRIADVGISLDLESIRLTRDKGRYGTFCSNGTAPEIRLRVAHGEAPSPRNTSPAFEVPGHWSLHLEYGRHLFDLCDPMTGRPNRFAELDTDHTRGVVKLGPETQFDVFGRPTLKRPRKTNPATILDPLLRIILAERMGMQNGLMLHAAAFVQGGQGIVFTGPSGSGKSTFSHIYGKHCPEATIIGDEHIILRHREDGWTVHGTPWPGSGFAVSQGGVPLKRIFIIHHDARNVAYPQKATASFSDLVGQAFLPRWNRTALNGALIAITNLVEGLTMKLGFINGPEIIDYVAKEVENA